MLLKKTTIINTKLFASNTPSTFLQRVLLARAKSTRLVILHESKEIVTIILLHLPMIFAN